MADPSSDLSKDPLASLHKMSTTAGLGSSDYVAINTLSIAALLLGLASSAAIPFAVFLILPLFGIVLGIISLRQISNSNGTQGGKMLAILGLLASIGFGGYSVTQLSIESIRDGRDSKSVEATINELGKYVVAKDYDKAYDLFDSKFKDRIPKSKFIESWKGYTGAPLFGSIDSFEWNGRVVFGDDEVTHSRVARSVALVKFQKLPGPAPQDVFLRTDKGKWYFEEYPALFTPEGAKPPKR